MYLEANGHFRIDSLFAERIAKRHRNVGTKPAYFLAERPRDKDAVTLYSVFINAVDEYDFAIKAFGSKAHLNKLKEISWFMNGWPGCLSFQGYTAWLEDMAERDLSLGKEVLIARAKEGDVSAAKKLVDMNRTPNAKGRPKKEDIQREAVRKADERQDIEDDLKRLNVIKIRG